MAISTTRQRGIAARKQYRETAGDSRMANASTPAARSPLRPRYHQGASRRDADMPRMMYREQEQVERQREESLRGWAQLALQSKDSDFAQKQQLWQQGMAERADKRSEGRFESDQEQRGYIRDRREILDTRQDERYEEDRTQRGSDRDRRKILEGRQDERYGEDRTQRASDRDRRKILEGQQDERYESGRDRQPILEGQRDEQFKHRMKRSRFDFERAQRIDKESQVRSPSPQPLPSKTAGYYTGQTKSLGIPQEEIRGEDGKLTGRGEDFLDTLDRLSMQNPKANPQELVKEAARIAGLRNRSSITESKIADTKDRIAELREANKDEMGYDSPRALRNESDEFHQNWKEIQTLEKQSKSQERKLKKQRKADAKRETRAKRKASAKQDPRTQQIIKAAQAGNQKAIRLLKQAGIQWQ